jgi:phospholipase C
MPTDLPTKVQHIVVLMMENRSFDHMLGGLKKQNPAIDGLNGNETNPDTTGAPVQVSGDADYQADLQNDPGHHYPDVDIQLFNGGDHSAPPTMQGFVKAYFEQTNNVPKSHNIMKYFSPGDLPVLTTLATRYAVFTRWFSSIPGPTLCNRAFAHFGTSFGNTGMSVDYFHKPIPSIYERMDQTGKNSAKLYYYNQTSSTLGLTFLLQDQPKLFGTFDQFVADCKANRLPQYSFLEPNYKDDDDLANDQHPDNDVRAGDDFIGTVYNLIRSSPAWQSTALLIVYDEHGGIYDHVPPPALDPNHPDGNTDAETGFKFDRLGIRVPAILVSPWVPAGTIIDGRVFEHASIPATVTNFFIDPNYTKRTKREQAADTFLDLLSLDQPRTDAFHFAVGNAASPHFPAHIESIPVPQPPPNSSNPERPISTLLQEHIQEVHKLEMTLPPEQQTGIDISQIRTMRQAGDYIGKITAQIHPLTAAGGAQ